jgi:hypothetical protein
MAVAADNAAYLNRQYCALLVAQTRQILRFDSDYLKQG